MGLLVMRELCGTVMESRVGRNMVMERGRNGSVCKGMGWRKDEGEWK